MLRFVLCIALIACSNNSSSTTGTTSSGGSATGSDVGGPPPDPGSGGTTTPPVDPPTGSGGTTQTDPPPSDMPPVAGGPKLHEKCGANDACGEGTCVTYFGIAGPRGPQFKTCEIKCTKTTKCPTGTSCGIVADGPGQVCRTDPPKPPPGDKPPVATGGPKLHEKCGANDACGEGTCVTYFGIAGPRGPQFKTCEIKCDKPTKCPAGTSCGIVADGPGKVCR
jgi:hypothetical protein